MSGIRREATLDPAFVAPGRAALLSREAVLFDEVRTNRRSLTNGALVSEDDHDIFLNASGGNVTVTLPNPALVPNREFRFKRVDSAANTCTVARFASEQIDGQASSLPLYSLMARTLKSDGTNWWIVEGYL